MSVSRSQRRVCQVSTLQLLFGGCGFLLWFISPVYFISCLPNTDFMWYHTQWIPCGLGVSKVRQGDHMDMLFSKPAHKVSCTGLWHWLHQQMRWLVLMCSVCKWSGHQWHASAALPPVGRSRTACHTHSVTKKHSLLVETHKNLATLWMDVTCETI